MGGFVLKLKSWWETADRTQRTVSIGGGAFLVLMIAVTFMFASRPHMSILYPGLNPTEQGSVVTELQKDGIATDADERGDVLVPSDKVTEARMKLANAGKLPTNNALGDEQLSKMNVFDTPEVERQRLKAMAESQLNETISSVDGIGSAQVHLVLGDDSPFVREAKPATASVSITERPGTTVSSQQAQAIASLVANSVKGLTLANVVVVNNRMEVLFDGRQENSSGGKVSQKIEAQIAEGRRRENEIQAMLDAVFGPQATIAKVNLDLDFDDRSTVKDENKPVKMPKAETTETMTNGKAGASGAASVSAPGTGPGTNSSTGASDGSNYTMSQKSNDYAVDTIHTDVRESSGALKSMTIDVIVNSDKVKDEAPVQKIIDGYLGAYSGKDGFKSTVTSVAFDTTAAAAATKAADEAKGSQKMQQIVSMLPIGALLIVGFLVMKSIGKFGKTTSVATAALPGGGSVPINFSNPALPSGALDSIRNVEGSYASYGEGGVRLEGQVGGPPGDDEAEAQLANIKGIGRKVNVPLEQIKKMSSDRPETVAMLIKGWLLEEQR